MFTSLAKRASGSAHFLKSATHNNIRNQNHRILRNNNSCSSTVVSLNSIRHQSSSSSSRDNDNSNNQDIEPISSNEVPINASIELHRVDLAHGSFFAMHRPLLGIANGPMFASHNSQFHEEDYEGKFFLHPVDDLVNYFSTLHPHTPPSPMIQPTLATPTATAWASMPPSMPDAEIAVEEFLRLVEDKQTLQAQQEDEHDRKQSSATTASTTAGNMDGIDEGSITTKSILDPMLQDESTAMHMTSVLRKRRIKMRKHKYKKLRKRTRALRKKLGK
ncbi:hypothetical protein BGZ96_004009 [Linnemannia gamsii]|uniref:Small ribosomal subunit protein mS38 n=1 Tax=Linnemannia gamsii TaxID=64522 RepID=A0ABQ7JIP1_9FUNG|nr:hypothetical protein BGZ96_004009 [Linnemannia gamsii]